MSLWWRVSDAFQTVRPRRIIPSEGGSKLSRARRWRNGRLDALKTHCPKGRVGSNPTRRTCYAVACRVQASIELIGRGFNDCEVAAALGIPRTTVRDWRHGCTAERRLMIREGCAACGQAAHDFASLPGPGYAYVLGMYLGDGDISRLPRTWPAARPRPQASPSDRAVGMANGLRS